MRPLFFLCYVSKYGKLLKYTLFKFSTYRTLLSFLLLEKVKTYNVISVNTPEQMKFGGALAESEGY